MSVDSPKNGLLQPNTSSPFYTSASFPPFAKTFTPNDTGKPLLAASISGGTKGIQIHRIWEKNDPLLGLSRAEKIRGVANRVLHSDFYKRWYVFLAILSTLCLVLTFIYSWYDMSFY